MYIRRVKRGLPLLLLCLLLATACRKECDYKRPDPVSITPIYIVTDNSGTGPPIQFVPESDLVLQEAGELGGTIFHNGTADGATLPLDWQRSTITYYFRHEGTTYQLTLSYTVQERYMGHECGFVTEYTNLRIISHNLVDAKVNDQELRLYFVAD